MRSIGIMAASVALVGLTACTPAEDKAAAPAPNTAQAAGPQPNETMRETFGANCTWGETTGAGLSVWSYACPQSGNTHMVYDASLPGFALEGTYDGQTGRSPAIIIFKKAAEATVESILPAIQARSPSTTTSQCVLVKATNDGRDYWTLEPTGALKARWDVMESGEGTEAMDAPCGALGPQMSGDRSFRVLADDPTTVVFVEYGSEIQPFDADTIRKVG